MAARGAQVESPLLFFWQPEHQRIQQMTAEVRQYARALIAPTALAYKARGSVAVKHAQAIDLTECSGGQKIAHPHEVRLKAMIVGRVADDLVPAGQVLQT